MDDLGIDDKIIENLNLIDMATKGCIINVCLKVHFLKGDSRECLWWRGVVLATSRFDENRR